MNSILLEWAWEGLDVILTAYLAAFVIKWTSAAIFKKVLPLFSTILLACLIYMLITWFVYKNLDIPLKSILPWLFLAPWIGGLVIFLKNLATFKSSPISQTISFLKPVAEIYLFFIILSCIYSLLILDNRFPVVVSGNNDIWDYSKYASFMLNKLTRNNIVGFDLFSSGTLDQTPSSMVFLAGLSSLTGKSVFNILELGMILVISSSTFFVKKIIQNSWKLSSSWAYLSAILWISASFPSYLVGNYFLAQHIGISLFLMSILFLYSDETRKSVQILTLTSLFSLIFMTYPAMFFPYTGIFVFSKGFEGLFLRKYQNSVFSKIPEYHFSLTSVLISIPASLLTIFFFDPSYFKTTIFNMIYLANVMVGWPFRLLNPLVLVSMPLTQGIDDDVVGHKTIGYCIVFALIAYLTFRSYRQCSLSKKQISLTILFVATLAGYLLYFILKGPSYQQWKLAGSVVMPMAFIPVVLIIQSLQSTFRTKLMAYFFLTLVITANITIVIRHANRSKNVLTRFLPLQEISSFDQDRRIRSITVDLKNHFQSTMIAIQFVNKKQIFLWSASYFNNNKQEHFSDIPQDGLLLTAGCSIFDHKNMIKLGKLYCAFLGPPKLANDYSIPDIRHF